MSMVTGLFKNGIEAATAVRELEKAGVPVDDISVIAADDAKEDAFVIKDKTHLGEGAAMGAGTGGAVGAIVAGLTSVGAIATGGVGLLAAGPVVAALAGAGAGAATGSVIGAAVGAAIPEHEIKFYEDAIGEGSVLIGVHAEDDRRRDLVKDRLRASGAARVSHA